NDGANDPSSAFLLDNGEQREEHFDVMEPEAASLRRRFLKPKKNKKKKKGKGKSGSTTTSDASAVAGCDDEASSGNGDGGKSSKSSKSRRRRRKLGKSSNGGDDDDGGTTDEDSSECEDRDDETIALLMCEAETTLPTGAVLSVDLDLSVLQGVDPTRVETEIRRLQEESRIGQAAITEGGVVSKFATFVYVIDNSGSTASACGNGVSVLQCEKDAIKALNGNITGVAINVGVVAFSSSGAPQDVDDDEGIQTLADPDVVAAIDQLRPVSRIGTNIDSGMNEAINLVQQSINDPSINVVETVIIVVTDGQFRYNPASDIQILKTLGTRVYTYAIGSGSSCVQQLEDLAFETGTEKCNRVLDPQELGLTFDEDFVATRTIQSVSVSVNDAEVSSSSVPPIPDTGLLPEDSPANVAAVLGFGGGDTGERSLRRSLQENENQEVCLSAFSRADEARCCVNVTATA
ncbi:MAG: hypothetical protein SGILL_009820, partial [Bacillariaceae sp.]